MKALVKAAIGPGLRLTDVPDPRPGPGDVLIKVLRTGICGTDLHIDSWDDWAAGQITPPLVVWKVTSTIKLVALWTANWPRSLAGK